jgi:hypothetical protein
MPDFCPRILLDTNVRFLGCSPELSGAHRKSRIAHCELLLRQCVQLRQRNSGNGSLKKCGIKVIDL